MTISSNNFEYACDYLKIGHIQTKNTIINELLDLKNMGLVTLFAFIALLH